MIKNLTVSCIEKESENWSYADVLKGKSLWVVNVKTKG